MQDMSEMTQFVYDFYQARLQLWKKTKREEELAEQKLKQQKRMEQLDEEEKLLREKLNDTYEKITQNKRLNIDFSETSSDEDGDNERDNDGDKNEPEMETA
jgi:multidrug efflux pump subunit AcrA (membrane-fusion protein)